MVKGEGEEQLRGVRDECKGPMRAVKKTACKRPGVKLGSNALSVFRWVHSEVSDQSCVVNSLKFTAIIPVVVPPPNPNQAEESKAAINCTRRGGQLLAKARSGQARGGMWSSTVLLDSQDIFNALMPCAKHMQVNENILNENKIK